MRTILYKDAAVLLGITENALKHAVGRGVLSRTSGEAKRNTLLVREQVELFIGKRVSFRYLDEEGLAAWRMYDRASRELTLSPTATELPPEQKIDIEELVRKQVERQVEERMAQRLNAEERKRTANERILEQVRRLLEKMSDETSFLPSPTLDVDALLGFILLMIIWYAGGKTNREAVEKEIRKLPDPMQIDRYRSLLDNKSLLRELQRIA